MGRRLFLHENPELKRTAFAWLTDFVGWLPIPGREREALLAADYNAEMIEQVERLPRIRDPALFVGNPDDRARRLRPRLAAIRDWTLEHFEFCRLHHRFDPSAFADREALRRDWASAPTSGSCSRRSAARASASTCCAG